MPWFKVDDGFIVSAKVISIPRSDRLLAIGLWTYAGNHSARHLTDGHIPKAVLDEIDAPQESIAHLVRVGLWDVDQAGEYWFHNWADYQPSAAAYIEKQAAIKAKRSRDGKISAAKRWNKHSDGSPNGSPIGSPNEFALGIDNPEPEPEPEPIEKKNQSKKINENFEVSEAMAIWFEKQSFKVDLETETSKFIDYYLANGATREDWVATWRSWMRKAQEFRKASLDVDPWAGKEHLGFAESPDPETSPRITFIDDEVF